MTLALSNWQKKVGCLLTLALTLTALNAQSGAPPAQAQTSFDEVARQAEAAREGGRLDEAIRLYHETVRQKPG